MQTTLKFLKVSRWSENARMYIGDTSERGFHHLVYEVVDNSIDEALAGYCDRSMLRSTSTIALPLLTTGVVFRLIFIQTEKVSAAEVVLTKLHAGGKFDKASYKVSGGLHGVGISVVNALSEDLEIEIKRDGKVYQQSYKRGDAAGTVSKEVGKSKERGTRSHSSPTVRSLKLPSLVSIFSRNDCASSRFSIAG